MFNFTATYTDQYQLVMAQALFLKGKHNITAVFDYFFRKLPFEGGYAIFAGLEDLISILQDFRFDREDLNFLEGIGFNPDFINFLEKFRFTGNIYSSLEGDIIFPIRPVLQVEANLIESQIIETILLNILNFQTLIATKASRMRLAAGDNILIDFGLRRAQGPGGYFASRAAFIGGFNASSNVRAGLDYGIPVAGTMAHSYIESYDDELTAFKHFADEHPNNCVLLLDTYDTLKSGLPNAVKTAKLMEEKGHRLSGIRLDSGDLAYLAKKCRETLDKEGLNYVKIAASNQLDENIIKSLLEQKAPIDVFGIGTKLVTGFQDAALDGVFKMAFANGKPRIKLSENLNKITLPHKKQVFRILDDNNDFAGIDVVSLHQEENLETVYHPLFPLKSLSVKGKKKEPLLSKVIENGVRLHDPVPLQQIAEYSRKQLTRLPDEYKRFNYPHIYKVSLSSKLKNERDILIEKYKRL